MDLSLYRKLFVHRSDVFAQQFPDGHYEPVRRELDDMDIEEHLGGVSSYGVYVIDPGTPSSARRVLPMGVSADEVGYRRENTVSYIVFDLDTYDESALDFLCAEVDKLVTEGSQSEGQADRYRKCLLLENSGGKGFHIWLFFDGPVPARDARLWASPVKEAYDSERLSPKRDNPAWGWPALEVFPKQDYVPEGGFGNLVKLPFGVHARSGNRSEVVPCQGWANGVPLVVGHPASLIPSAPADTRRLSSDAGRTAPFACISKLIEEGAPQGMRDNAMFHFCHYACGTGLPEDLVHEWAERVNQEFSPPLTDFEVEKSVASATRMAAPHPGCGADWLRDFCPGGENCFAPWNERTDKPRKERVAPLDVDDDYEAWERRQQ